VKADFSSPFLAIESVPIPKVFFFLFAFIILAVAAGIYGLSKLLPKSDIYAV